MTVGLERESQQNLTETPLRVSRDSGGRLHIGVFLGDDRLREVGMRVDEEAQGLRIIVTDTLNLSARVPKVISHGSVAIDSSHVDPSYLDTTVRLQDVLSTATKGIEIFKAGPRGSEINSGQASIADKLKELGIHNGPLASQFTVMDSLLHMPHVQGYKPSSLRKVRELMHGAR